MAGEELQKAISKQPQLEKPQLPKAELGGAGVPPKSSTGGSEIPPLVSKIKISLVI